ncbi:MAG: Hpt domain-containing protein [Alphaproteobacteria bacterium]|nr:Hpt domain-containing protein [Alphaproteobacteria bacterium]
MSASTARAIDFNHLDSYTAGDQDLIREVLRLFKGQVGQLVGGLHTAPDAKTWRETAHGIKGAARGIGAWKAADAAADVEKTDFANVAGRTAALNVLVAAFADVAAEIESELA